MKTKRIIYTYFAFTSIILHIAIAALCLFRWPIVYGFTVGMKHALTSSYDHERNSVEYHGTIKDISTLDAHGINHYGISIDINGQSVYAESRKDKFSIGDSVTVTATRLRLSNGDIVSMHVHKE